MNDIPTREKLALALEAANAPKWIIERARQKYYDDYESPLPFPITQLYKDLMSIPMHDMAQRVVNGDFDATTEESNNWAKSQDGIATFSELFKHKKD